MLQNLLSVDDICHQLGIGKNTAYTIAKEVKHIKIGKKIYIPDYELANYIQAKLR